MTSVLYVSIYLVLVLVLILVVVVVVDDVDVGQTLSVSGKCSIVPAFLLVSVV